MNVTVIEVAFVIIIFILVIIIIKTLKDLLRGDN
jgi:hypothetical protein